MTFSRLSIIRLRIEAFRGFRDEFVFDLNANAIVVSGPNGTGKTSFFDALQWGLLGRLERLETLRSRKNAEHIVNQYRKGGKAVVEVTLGTPSGEVLLRRTGDQGGSTLELERDGEPPLFGEEAEATLRSTLLPLSELRLDTALTTTGLMQQDVLRRVLEAKPSDRYQEMSAVLGLGALEEFEEATRLAAKRAGERAAAAREQVSELREALRQTRDRMESSQVRLSNRPQIEALRSMVAEALRAEPEGLTSSATEWSFSNIEDVRRADFQFARAEELLQEAQFLVEDALRKADIPTDRPDDAGLTALRDELSKAKTRRDMAEHLRGVAQSTLNAARIAAEDVAKLAALAIPMLTSKCPICGQNIDRARVESELLERAQSSGSLLQLERDFDKLHQDFVDAVEEHARLEDMVSSTESMIERWQESRARALEAQDAIDFFFEQVPFLQFDVLDLKSFLTIASPLSGYLRRVRRALQDLLGTFDRHAEQGDLERMAAEIASLESAITLAETRFGNESERSGKLRRLSEATVEARVDVTEQRLRSLQPLVSNIYQRLDPHPTFKAVDFELDTYYRKGTTSPLVVDQVEGIEADPVLIFSTSQANIVALSYFIAMNLSMEVNGLPFLLLDDPVQSMDDVNVLGFADLCRHLRSRRQIIVSTHERRLTNLLERKLAPRVDGSTTKVFRFTGWDRGGPIVEQSEVQRELIGAPIRLLKHVG